MLLRFCAIFWLFAALSLAVEPKNSFQILYTSNRSGEMEPCGCQVHQIGGINRMQAFIDSTRQKQTDAFFIADAGDTFFSTPALLPTRHAQEELRAKAVAEAYAIMAVDVLSPGERDFANGIDFLRQLQSTSHAKFLSANLTDTNGTLLFEPYTVLQKKGSKVAFIGISGEEAFANVEGVKTQPALDRFKEVLAEVKKQNPDKIVVLSHLGLAGDRELAKIDESLAIIGSHSLDILTDPEKVNRSLIVQPHNEGQQVGILSFAGENLANHTLNDLGKEWDKKNAVRKIMERYKDQVRILGISADAGLIPNKKNSGFVAHPFQCRSCHEEQYDFWAKTWHASSYLILYAKNQNFDSDCIGCHSLGFKKDGGFQKITEPIELVDKSRTKTPFIEELIKKATGGESRKAMLAARKDPEKYAKYRQAYLQEISHLEEQKKILKNFTGTQCEHCHGNLSGHPGVKRVSTKVSVETCKQCHRPPNVLHFDPESIKKVSCPLMKKEKAE